MFAYSWDGSDDDLNEDFGNEAFGEGLAPDWQDAACRDGSGSLTALFFSDEMVDIELAKAICAGCSLERSCLQGALARREPAGVWGGQLFVEGQVVAFKRKRGRPRKSPVATATAPAAMVRAREERKSA
jgi:WhiB family redox-sensing transcriptional regulator